jgi:hypothetical protein
MTEKPGPPRCVCYLGFYLLCPRACRAVLSVEFPFTHLSFARLRVAQKLPRLINCLGEDPLPAVGDADKKALLIHIVRVALFNLMFLHLRVQQVKVQLLFTLFVS